MLVLDCAQNITMLHLGKESLNLLHIYTEKDLLKQTMHFGPWYKSWMSMVVIIANLGQRQKSA